MAEFKEISPDAPMAQKALNWVDNRFPLSKLYNEHLAEYYAPKNFNFWYFFGSLALLVLVIQIVTGIFLVNTTSPMRPWRLPRWNTSCEMCRGAG
jgi:ubiquinol-cytochrome c reductase cytochrome b subunit